MGKLRGGALIALAGVGMFSLVLVAAANEIPPPETELTVLLNSEQPYLYNGTKSQPGEFPAMGWIGNCTGTLVAKNVVFTAAHCVSNGKRITFEHRGGESVRGTCKRHPRANRGSYWVNDYAFCKLDSEVAEGTVLAQFDTEKQPAVGDDVLLNGFGRPNIRVHYWGKGTVRRYDGQDIVTCGPSNLGGGDSGGSVLRWTEDRSGEGGFKVVGVNSRGNNRCSWLNRIADDAFTDFAMDYEDSEGVELCGVSIDCHSETPPPPPPPGPLPPESCVEPFQETKRVYGTFESSATHLDAMVLADAAIGYAICLEEQGFIFNP